MKKNVQHRTSNIEHQREEKKHRRLFRRQSVVELGGIDVPAKALLRYGEVRQCLGVNREAVNALVEDGKLQLALGGGV